jgi:hypothetical protein
VTIYESDSCCLSSATKLNFMIYNDNSGVPDGYPGGGNPPIWSVSLSPSDPQLDIDEFDDGEHFCTSDILLIIPSIPVELERGSYWLVFYPELDSSCGEAYRPTSSSLRGYDGQTIYPNDTDPNWNNWFSFHDRSSSIDHQDLIFILWGTSTGGSNPGVELLLLGD